MEGNNINSDIWAEEHADGSPYRDKSGDAVDHYHRYREDIGLLADLGLNAYRFSIEWARVEPEPGMYSRAVIEHYRDVLNACLERGMVPVVTMHHFSSPRWLMRFGGWKDPGTPDRFAKYCEIVFRELGDWIPWVQTINEINLPILLRDLFTRMNFMPPVGIDASYWTAPRWRELAAAACGTTADRYFTFHMASDKASIAIVKDAHRKAREAIKSVSPGTKVGLSMALSDIQALPGGEAEAERAWEMTFRQYADVLRDDDFVGVQTYTRERYGPEGRLPHASDAELTQAGYEFYPAALGNVIRKVARELPLPILVSENGIATDDDSRREAYIRQALSGVRDCLADDIRVIGYFYWSAFDNFEWTFGYAMRFGIIGVDRTTFCRTVKESARLLGRIAKSNGAILR